MKPPRPRVNVGFVIVGPFGNIWNDKLFDSREDAKKCIAARFENKVIDWSAWKLIPATMTIEAICQQTVECLSLNDTV